MTSPAERELKREMVSSGVIYCLASDIVRGEIDMSVMPMHLTDELQLGDYKRDIERKFGVCEPAFLSEVIDIAVTRFKTCRRRGLDYWGRPTDPDYLW